MVRLRVGWVLGLVLGVSGCAGTGRRPGMPPAPPILGATAPADARGVREAALVRRGASEPAALPEPEDWRKPRGLSRFFPGLARRERSTPVPPDSRAAAAVAGHAPAGPAELRWGRAQPEPDEDVAPLLSVAIDVAAPPAAPAGFSRSVPDDAGERLTALESVAGSAPGAPAGPSRAAEPDAPPPLAEATPSGARTPAPGSRPKPAVASTPDPGADPVLAGRPRLRPTSATAPAGLPPGVPPALFPRTYYSTGAPPVAARVSVAEPAQRPRLFRWIRRLRPAPDDPEPSAASVRREPGHVPQGG